MTDDTSRASPGSVERDPLQTASTSRRYLSIDIIRGLAIILMIQVHAADNLSRRIPTPDYLWDISQILGHTPAPLFTFVSGVSYWLWLAAQRRAGHSNEEIVKYSLRRGLFLVVLGVVVNVCIWLPESTFDWDILALIGMSTIVLTMVRDWRPGTLMVLAALIFLLSPPLRDVLHYDDHWNTTGEFVYRMRFFEVLGGLVVLGYFPLLPWLIFPLIGFAVAKMFASEREGIVLTRSVPLAGIVMIALAVVGGAFQAQMPAWLTRYYASGWPDGFYPATSVFILAALGGTLLFGWILNRTLDRNPRVTGEGAVLLFFRRYSYFALTAYVAHLAAQVWPLRVLALWEGTRIDFYSGRLWTVPASLASALVLIVLLYIFFIFLDRHRKYSLEGIMRWLCS